jgi:hypothetical protein
MLPLESAAILGKSKSGFGVLSFSIQSMCLDFDFCENPRSIPGVHLG